MLLKLWVRGRDYKYFAYGYLIHISDCHLIQVKGDGTNIKTKTVLVGGF